MTGGDQTSSIFLVFPFLKKQPKVTQNHLPLRSCCKPFLNNHDLYKRTVFSGLAISFVNTCASTTERPVINFNDPTLSSFKRAPRIQHRQIAGQYLFTSSPFTLCPPRLCSSSPEKHQHQPFCLPLGRERGSEVAQRAQLLKQNKAQRCFWFGRQEPVLQRLVLSEGSKRRF